MGLNPASDVVVGVDGFTIYSLNRRHKIIKTHNYAERVYSSHTANALYGSTHNSAPPDCTALGGAYRAAVLPSYRTAVKLLDFSLHNDLCVFLTHTRVPDVNYYTVIVVINSIKENNRNCRSYECNEKNGIKFHVRLDC